MSQPSIPFAVKRRGGEPAAKRTKTDNRLTQDPFFVQAGYQLFVQGVSLCILRICLTCHAHTHRQPQNPSSPPLSDKVSSEGTMCVFLCAVETMGRASHPSSPSHPSQALLVSILDIVEANNGREFHIWALDHIGRRALLRVTDFAPYLYLTAPCAVC